MTISDDMDLLAPLVREYRHGKLSPEQERAFEERLMREPSLVEAVELDAALERGIRRPVPMRVRWAYPAALAACLLAGVGLGFGLFHRPPARDMVLQVQPLRFDVLRGGESRTVRTARRDGGALIIEIPAFSPPASTVALDSPGQQLRLMAEHPAENGRLAFMVPLTALTEMEYRILIDGEDRYRFSLRIEPAASR